jgi:hypothetical protein
MALGMGVCVDCGTAESERWVFRRGAWRCQACDKKLESAGPVMPTVHGRLNITLDPTKVR